MSLQPSENIEHGIGVASIQYVHTSFIFNKCTDFFSVMNIAVVQNKDASRTWIRIGEGDLHAVSDIRFKTKCVNTYHKFVKEQKELL